MFLPPPPWKILPSTLPWKKVYGRPWVELSLLTITKLCLIKMHCIVSISLQCEIEKYVFARIKVYNEKRDGKRFQSKIFNNFSWVYQISASLSDDLHVRINKIADRFNLTLQLRIHRSQRILVRLKNGKKCSV